MTRKPLEFFIPMKKIPTVTHQEKQVAVIKGKPHFYEPPELQADRSLITDSLGKFAPKEPFPSKVRLLGNIAILQQVNIRMVSTNGLSLIWITI